MQKAEKSRDNYIKILEEQIKTYNLFLTSQKLFNPVIGQIKITPIFKLREMIENSNQLNFKNIIASKRRMTVIAKYDQGQNTNLCNLDNDFIFTIKTKTHYQKIVKSQLLSKDQGITAKLPNHDVGVGTNVTVAQRECQTTVKTKDIEGLEMAEK